MPLLFWIFEVVAPSETYFDPGANLCFDEIWVDCHSHPTYMQVILKASKTDPFRLGTSLFIGAIDSHLCPVAAVISFMLARGNAPGLLFTGKNGRYLTRDRFVTEIRKVLSAGGYKAQNYAGHNFRIGAATTVARRGLQDSLITMLGRWLSSAYTLYIKTPREILCGVAKELEATQESHQVLSSMVKGSTATDQRRSQATSRGVGNGS